jgi:K+-sensing histidine kinase KdpD
VAKRLEGTQVRALKGVYPLAVSLGVMAAAIYLYLFPVALIAVLYNGRLAVLCAAVAMVCADLFLQKPLYNLANDNPLEYGHLVFFALLAVTTIKFVRVLARPPSKSSDAGTHYGWG